MAEDMNTKAQGMSAKDREKLVKRKAQLEAAISKGELSDEVLKEMRMTVMQIEGQLGESPTPGRAPVDAPSGMMYGGMAKKKMMMGGEAKKKKKMMMGGKAYSNPTRKPMMYGGMAGKK